MFRMLRLNPLRYVRNRSMQYLNVVRPLLINQERWKSSCTVGESHDERNMRLKRPQSPHLLIYKPQLTAMLSITQRMTGVLLASYLIGLGFGAIFLPCDIPYYLNELECLHLNMVIVNGMKFCIALPLCYHFWNGIRHLIWDTGALLSLSQVYITGYIMLLLALSSAAALACICLEDEEEEEKKEGETEYDDEDDD